MRYHRTFDLFNRGQYQTADYDRHAWYAARGSLFITSCTRSVATVMLADTLSEVSE